MKLKKIIDSKTIAILMAYSVISKIAIDEYKKDERKIRRKKIIKIIRKSLRIFVILFFISVSIYLFFFLKLADK